MDKPTLLVVIYSDPEKSGLTAEALRMAMGLGTGNRKLEIALMGPAAQVLTEDVDELVDGEMIETNLDVLADWDLPFHVDRRATERYDLEDAPVDVVAVDGPDLAGMMTRARHVMVFR